MKKKNPSWYVTEGPLLGEDLHMAVHAIVVNSHTKNTALCMQRLFTEIVLAEGPLFHQKSVDRNKIQYLQASRGKKHSFFLTILSPSSVSPLHYTFPSRFLPVLG